MTARLSKEDIRNTTGILNPVGHVILAFKDDAVTAQAVDALRAAGSGADDILVYRAYEATPRLRERVQTASEAAGFGYEITLMRRYMTLAGEGAGWLVVYSPDEAQVAKVTEIAKRFGATSAVHYGRLLHEDLI